MAFDIGATLEEMLGAAGNVLNKEAPKVRQCLRDAMEAEKEALAEIAKARLDNEITEEEMQSQIEDEKDALRAALLVCQVKSKVAMQKALNAAADIFSNAVKAALKVI